MFQRVIFPFAILIGISSGLTHNTICWSQDAAAPAASPVKAEKATEPEATATETTSTVSESKESANTEKVAETEKADQPFEAITFEFTTVPTMFGIIEKVTETGEVHIKTSSIDYPEGKVAQVAAPEIDFLAFTSPSLQPEGIHPVMKVLKARFQAIPADDKAVLLVAPEQYEQLRVGSPIAAIRPVELKDEDFVKIPDMAHINFQSQPGNSPEALNFQKTHSNLSKVGQALMQYQAKHGSLPPAALKGPDGKLWHSWRVLVLPFMDQQELYDTYKFTEPWDSEANKKLLSQIPEAYQNQYDTNADSHFTQAAVITGAKTAFETVEFDGTKEGLEKIAGKKQDDIVDNLNLTVLGGLISPKAKISWTEPHDITLEEFKGIDEEKGFFTPMKHESFLSDFGLMIFASGNLQFVRKEAELDDLTGLLTINGEESGEQEMLQRLTPPYNARNNNKPMKNVPYVVIYPNAKDSIAGYYNKQIPIEEE